MKALGTRMHSSSSIGGNRTVKIGGTPRGGNRAVKMSDVTCEYLEDMSKQLSILAFKNGLDSLAVLFDMARQEAERLRVLSDEHLGRR